MFLARTDEQRRFAGALEEIQAARSFMSASQVFLLHGLGGMGKTELCHRYAAMAKGQLRESRFEQDSFLVGTVNWQEERRNFGLRASPEGVPPSAVFAAIHNALLLPVGVEVERSVARQGAVAFSPYVQTAAELSDPALIRAAAKGGPVAPASEPLGDVLTHLIEQGGAGVGGASLGMAAGGLARAIRERSRAGDQSAVNRERFEELLTRQFAQGLREMSERKPIVIILDHYEIVASCGSWIRKAMLQSGQRVVWVIAARLEPEEEAGSRGDLSAFRRDIPEESLRIIPMSTFERRTIKEELEQRGVEGIDDVMLEGVESLTSGVPMAVSLVAGLLAQGEDLQEIGRAVTEKGDTTKLVRELAERYLVHTLEDPDLADDAPLLLGMALLYADRGDADVLRAIWGEEHEIEATLMRLSERHDFVLTGSRRLHQEVRDRFRQYLLDGVRRSERRAANRRAAETVLARVDEDAAASCEENLRREEWRLDVATLVWHRFWEGNDLGLETVCQVFPAAVLLNGTFAHQLVDIASFFKDTFSDKQKVVLRGLASLLSFGSFLDGWRARRRSTLDPGPDRDPSLAEQATVLETLRTHAGSNSLASLAQIGPSLVNLLTAKTLVLTEPSVALAELTAASAGLAANGGGLASEVAGTASELASRMVEPNPGGEATVPSAGGMRAGELWRAYASYPASVLLWFGRAHRYREEYEEALGVYDELDEMFSEKEDEESQSWAAEALLGRAWVLDKRGESQPELACYDAVIETVGEEHSLRRHRASAMYARAMTLVEIEEPPKASAEFQRVFDQFKDDLDPKLRRVAARAAHRKSNLLLEENQPQSALEALDELIAWPEDADEVVRYNTALAYLAKSSILHQLRRWKDLDITCDEMDRRFEQDKGKVFELTRLRVLKNKASGLLCSVREKDGMGVLDQLLDRIDEDHAEFRRLAITAIWWKTVTLLELGEAVDVAAARKEIERLLGIEPCPPGSLVDYAYFLAGVSDDSELVEDAFVKAGEGPEQVAYLACFHFEQGNLERGRELSNNVLSMSELDPETELEIRYCLALMGAGGRTTNLEEIWKLLVEGDVRSPGWNLQRLLDQARRQNRGDLDWLEKLGGVVRDRMPLDVLQGWPAWPGT